MGRERRQAPEDREGRWHLSAPTRGTQPALGKPGHLSEQNIQHDGNPKPASERRSQVTCSGDPSSLRLKTPRELGPGFA